MENFFVLNPYKFRDLSRNTQFHNWGDALINGDIVTFGLIFS